MKLGLAIAVAVGLLAATRILFSISIVPPALGDNSLQLSSASTQVLVDTPDSALVDLRQTTYDIDSLTNRGVLVGNVMASPQVREMVGKRAGVPARQVTITPPLTADQPRPLSGTGHDPSVTDLVASPGQPRVTVEASPTSPVLTIRAEASDPDLARRLADGTVTATRDYMSQIADLEATPTDSRVKLIQLGPASGGVVNSGAPVAMAVLAFVAAFGLTCVVVLFVARVRSGWSGRADLGGNPAAGAT
jgi:hypothetical protein